MGCQQVVPNASISFQFRRAGRLRASGQRSSSDGVRMYLFVRATGLRGQSRCTRGISVFFVAGFFSRRGRSVTLLNRLSLASSSGVCCGATITRTQSLPRRLSHRSSTYTSCIQNESVACRLHSVCLHRQLRVARFPVSQRQRIQNWATVNWFSFWSFAARVRQRGRCAAARTSRWHSNTRKRLFLVLCFNHHSRSRATVIVAS